MQYLEKAAVIVGIKIEETGALGQRTKFQQRDLPQFTLNFIKERNHSAPDDLPVQSNAVSGMSETNKDLPRDVKLDDEVRLEKIRFVNQREPPVLTKEEQCFLFALYILVKRSQPKDELSNEKLLPYLEALLGQRSDQIWALRTNTLLERSKLERDNRRTVERSLMQIEALVEQYKTEEVVSIDYRRRMEHVYAARLAPCWQVETELVRLYQIMGSTKSALDLALRLELWEDVIHSYHLLNLRHKAAEVIRAKIEKEGETPLLMCMLGDATDDVIHYERALELSYNKSSRAYRSLGMRQYSLKNYREAVDLLTKSVGLNGFQTDILLRLGYAALQIEDWNTAATTYRKYCNYESDNFEAWNNLANAYIKLGQRSRAFTVLQEAAKCDYDNWKIWDNILVISVDCGHFEEAIRAYHRILDLHESKSRSSFEGNTKMKKIVDAEVLEALVQAVTSDEITDTFGESANHVHKPGLLKLFARIATLTPKQDKFYELYAVLLTSCSPRANQVDATNNSANRSEQLFKAAQMMQKATAAFQTQHNGWEKSLEQCKHGVSLAVRYAEFCLDAENVQQLASAKMTIKSMLTRIKKSQSSMDTDEIKEPLMLPYQQLNDAVERIVCKINELK